MRKFSYPLERVLHFRRLGLEIEQSRLARLRADLASLDQMRREVDRQARQASTDVRTPAGPSRELDVYGAFRDSTRRLDRRLASRRAELLEKAGVQLQAVLEAHRRCEVLERSRNKALEDWRRGQFREEEALAGELHLARLSRER